MLLTLIIFYLAFTLTIGLLATRRVKGAEDFALAGRKLPFHLCLSSFFATWYGAETILGVSSQFASQGFQGIIEDPLGASLCLFLTGFFFVKYFYPKGYLSIGDFFRERYGPRFEFSASLVQALSYFTYTAAQFVALGLVLQTVTGYSFVFCLLLGSSVVMVYTFFGGMWAIATTDFFQSIVIIIGLTGLAYFVWNEWGCKLSWKELAPKSGLNPLPANNFQGWATYFTAWAVMGLGSIPSQDIFQRVMSAKSEKVARNSAIWAGLGYLLFAALPIYIVMIYIRSFGITTKSDPQQIIPNMVLQHAPLAVQALFFGALLSAILSTASASLLAQATVISENLLKPRIKQLPEATFLLLMRCTVVAVTFISIGIALQTKSIFLLASSSSSFVLVTLFVPMVGGLAWKNAGEISAHLSLAAGLSTYLICTSFEMGLMGVFFGFLASIFGFFLPLIFQRHRKQTISTQPPYFPPQF